MDRAVLDAYGWHDISTDCEFRLDYAIDEDEWSRRKKPTSIAGPTPPATRSSPASWNSTPPVPLRKPARGRQRLVEYGPGE